MRIRQLPSRPGTEEGQAASDRVAAAKEAHKTAATVARLLKKAKAPPVVVAAKKAEATRLWEAYQAAEDEFLESLKQGLQG